VYDFEWSRAQKKGKLPTTTLDKKVGEAIEQIITSREAGYTTSFQVSQSLHVHICLLTTQEDLDIAKAAESVRDPRINAAIVRLGEKRVLKVARRVLRAEVAKKGVEKVESDDKDKKRKSDTGRSAKMGKMKLS
jgi:hypothetical protein